MFGRPVPAFARHEFEPVRGGADDDGLNDRLCAVSWGHLEDFEFFIFNRWGQRVFHTKSPSDCWDGTFKGKKCPVDGYVYFINAKTIEYL